MFTFRAIARRGLAACCGLMAAVALAQPASAQEGARRVREVINLDTGLAQPAPAQEGAPQRPEPVAQAQAPAAEAADRAFVITPGDGRLGTFKTVQGQVTLAQGDTRRAAVVGGALLPQERLSTGADGIAAVTLRDGTVLTLGPDSSLDLAEFDFNSTTQEGSMWVKLARGSLRVITGLIAKLQPEKVKVTTPTAVIGVRGTDFSVETRP